MAESVFWEPTLRKANERAAAFLSTLGATERTSQAHECLNGWRLTIYYDLPVPAALAKASPPQKQNEGDA